MKKIKVIKILLLLTSSSFLLSSCEDLVSTDTASSNDLLNYILASSLTASSDDVEINGTANWNYSEANNIFLLDENVGELKIYGDLRGKEIYYVPVNTSSRNVSGEYVKYLKSGSFTQSGNSSISSSFSPSDMATAVSGLSESSGIGYSHYKGYDFMPDTKNISSKFSYYSVSSNSTQIETYTDGVTKKNFYVSLDENENSPSYEPATLRAHNDVCNVWVLDDYYAETSEAGKVNSAKAQSFADAFASFYPLITNIFGNESDYVYSWHNYGYLTTSDMNAVSDTKRKINIVIYDLFGDADNESNGKVLGFFSNRDYFSNRLLNAMGYASSSNYGKYFYIDSYCANTHADTIISTLAHEFQHMIHFGKKTMNDLDSDTNFNEMLSMLCEDMMQDFLGISDSDSPRGRFSQFMAEYSLCGIRDYDDTARSYANAYAFGSWLCRQYGGAALVKEMMSNGKVNNDCIVSAVNSLNGTSFSFDELFGQFIKACLGDATYTFNQNAAQTLTYSGYSYPMTAINLWERNSIYDLSRIFNNDGESLKQIMQSNFTTSSGILLLATGVYDYFGPCVFINGTSFYNIAQNYGMFLKYIATIEEATSSLTLNFATEKGSTKTGLKTYVYIK